LTQDTMHGNWSVSTKIGTGTMRQIWTAALASLLLVGFAAVVSATAIAVAAEADARPAGRIKMIDAQYRLAIALRR